MRRLLSQMEAPPQDGEGYSFRYVFPEDAFVARASSYPDWKQIILDHAIGNNLPVPDMATCEDQLCGSLPPDKCRYEQGDPPAAYVYFTAGDVGAWIKAVAEKIALGSQFVPQEEAERRAEICVRCPQNLPAHGCAGCAKIAEMLTPGMSAKHTREDDRLKNCSVCKCYNRMQVHFPLDILRSSGSIDGVYPEWCWKA